MEVNVSQSREEFLTDLKNKVNLAFQNRRQETSRVDSETTIEFKEIQKQ